MIWTNATKFGKNFIAPQIFLAGTLMIIARNICANVIYVKVCFHYECGIKYSLFVLLIFYFFPRLSTKRNKKITKRKKEYFISRL